MYAFTPSLYDSSISRSSREEVNTTTGIIFIFFIRLDFLQDLNAVDFRHFEIEQNNLRGASHLIRKEVCQGFFTIVKVQEIVAKIVLFQDANGEIRVIRVIFNK